MKIWKLGSNTDPVILIRAYQFTRFNEHDIFEKFWKTEWIVPHKTNERVNSFSGKSKNKIQVSETLNYTGFFEIVQQKSMQ